MLDWVKQTRADLHRLAIGGAWLFAVGSLLPLVWLIVEGGGWPVDARVFGASTAGSDHAAWALTYRGFGGAILLWLELLATGAAALFTVLPPPRLRRIGHAWLIAWSGLWVLGTVHMALVAPGFFILQAAVAIVFFGCTVYRAVQSWPTRSADCTARSGVESPCFEAEHDDASQAQADPTSQRQRQPMEAMRRLYRQLSEMVTPHVNRLKPAFGVRASQVMSIGQTRLREAAEASRRFAFSQLSRAAAALKPHDTSKPTHPTA